ncbi:hypothetical protein AQ623_01745 [Flavobacterium columnare]|nr:hypothetical protein AQ623_01745 [Flavobacterium columnare]
MNAQTTQTINSKLKLTNVPVGTSNDSILVRGADKIVKKLPKSALFATVPTPNIQQVTSAGNITSNSISFTDNQSRTSNINSGQLVVFDASNNTSGIYKNDGLAFNKTTGTYNLQPEANGTAGNYTINIPSANGTLALKENTVGDFINDGATTMAPSQNAVFDALANKVSKTGNESIAGEKNFTNVAYFSSPSGSQHSNITLMADPFGFGFAASHDYPIIGNKNNNFSFASGKPSAMSYAASLDAKGLTANRSYAFPNQSGTVALSDNTVNLSGNQTIGGIKTFTGGIYSNNQINSPNGYKFYDYANDKELEFIGYDGGFRFLYGGLPALSFSSNEGFGLNNASGQQFFLNTSNVTTNKEQKFINSNGSIPVIRLTAPTSSIDTGVVGEMYVDNNFLYYCYSPDRWRRVATDSNWNIDE